MGPTILLNIHWSSPVYTKLSVVHFTLSDYRNYINFLEWVFRYPMNRILPFHNRTCWNGNAYQNRKFKCQSINVRVVIIIFNIKHPWNSFCQFWIPMTKANLHFLLQTWERYSFQSLWQNHKTNTTSGLLSKIITSNPLVHIQQTINFMEMHYCLCLNGTQRCKKIMAHETSINLNK